ncbi:MAG: PadR family transcriptional regulator, regulatory protein PadR [Actinomycetota bacterium]|jgi:DNA-binding PadR family transcriptional regulator
MKGHLDLLLLSVLRDGPAHGYAVIARVAERSDGHFDFAEGTVYPALHKLESEGLVVSDWSTEGGRKRRVYALSAAGGEALAELKAEWTRFARGMQAVLAS